MRLLSLTRIVSLMCINFFLLTGRGYKSDYCIVDSNEPIGYAWLYNHALANIIDSVNWTMFVVYIAT